MYEMLTKITIFACFSQKFLWFCIILKLYVLLEYFKSVKSISISQYVLVHAMKDEDKRKQVSTVNYQSKFCLLSSISFISISLLV